MTAVNGVPIVYDNLGNPISYLGNTLSWEKGRQLKYFDSNTYTYNANGIRTSKTVDGVKHTYALDGTKILKETWGDCTLIPLYDNEDSVCGIIYDDAAYYFHKNLQGDVIEIKNAYGVFYRCLLGSMGQGDQSDSMGFASHPVVIDCCICGFVLSV